MHQYEFAASYMGKQIQRKSHCLNCSKDLIIFHGTENLSHFLTNLPILHMKDEVKLLGGEFNIDFV